MPMDNTNPPQDADNTKNDKQIEENTYEFRFKDYAIEDYVVLVVFWALAAVVFAQFFSRYVLNSSIVWTEEVARYLLIATGFLGSVMAVRKRGHIYVEVFYRFLPPVVGRVMSTMVDIIKILFFAVGNVSGYPHYAHYEKPAYGFPSPAHDLCLFPRYGGVHYYDHPQCSDSMAAPEIRLHSRHKRSG